MDSDVLCGLDALSQSGMSGCFLIPDLDTTALSQDKTRRISTLDLNPSGE